MGTGQQWIKLLSGEGLPSEPAHSASPTHPWCHRWAGRSRLQQRVSAACFTGERLSCSRSGVWPREQPGCSFPGL